MFSQELQDYECATLIQQGKITNIGEAIRYLNQKYFKVWMKMYCPDISSEFLDNCHGYLLLAFWSGVDYANENHEKKTKKKKRFHFLTN